MCGLKLGQPAFTQSQREREREMFRCISALRNFDLLLPLQQRVVKPLGWARAAPPSGYHSALPHAVELVHSEPTNTQLLLYGDTQTVWCSKQRWWREHESCSICILNNNNSVHMCQLYRRMRTHLLCSVLYVGAFTLPLFVSVIVLSHTIVKTGVTFPAASGGAFFCSSRLATSIFPYFAATCKGVKPFWRDTEQKKRALS